MRLHRTPAFALLLFATSTLCFAAADGSFDRTLTVNGPAQLDVKTGSGNITITGTNGNQVVIHAKIHASDQWFGGGIPASERVKRLEQNPPVEQSGNYIRIGHITDDELRRNVSISYEIQTPRNSQIKGSTGSGDERITDIAGSVTVESGSGSQHISGAGAEVRASTGSGDIEARDIKGHLNIETGSGTVRASNVASGARLRTGSGDITFEQTAPGDVNAETGSGTLHLKNIRGGLQATTGSGDIEVDGAMQGSWHLDTGSGTVNVHLPNDAKFDVRARSSSGGVNVDHPVTVQGAIKRNSVEGSVRGGGPLLSIQTGSGSIHVN